MNNDLDRLTLIVLSALEDIKGQNIQLFDAQPLTGLFDRVVVVSGTSNRQTRAMAKNLHDKVKQGGFGVYGAEGEETGEWVLVDLGDVIVHIMQPEIRDYYRLEEIWGKHPIDWEALQEAARKPAPKRKATAKKPIVEKTPVKVTAPEAKPVVKPRKNKTAAEKKAEAFASDKPKAKEPAAKKSSSKSRASSGAGTGKGAGAAASKGKSASKPGVKKPVTKKPAAKKPAAKKPATNNKTKK